MDHLIQTTTKKLPAPISDDRALELAREAQDLREQIDRARELEAARRKLATEEIAEREQAMRAALLAAATGLEQRAIDCEVRLRGDKIIITRLDTGDVVDSRPATAEDRQLEVQP